MSASAYRRAREVAAKKVEEDRLAALIKQEEIPVINVTIEPPVEEVTSNEDNVKVKKVKRSSK